MPGKVFISYRRSDCATAAHAIAQSLAARFGQKQVLLDLDMISGTEFPKALKTWLSRCKVLLVLIGPGWLNASAQSGTRRLDEPDDWVRLEIKSALDRGIAVIPVLVDDATLPKKAELPADIAGLLSRQAKLVRTRPFESFKNDMAALARDIDRHRRPPPWIWPIAAVVVLLIGGAAYYGWGTVVPKPTAAPLPDSGSGVTAAKTPTLSTAEVLERCIRDPRHPDAAAIAGDLARRFARDKFRYGWTAESQQPRSDPTIVWHDIVEASASNDVLMLRIPWRNGRIRLVPVVKRQYSTRGIANVSLVVQGMWSQDNGYGCVELTFDNNGDARGAIGVMTANRLDTQAFVESAR